MSEDLHSDAFSRFFLLEARRREAAIELWNPDDRQLCGFGLTDAVLRYNLLALL